MIMMTNKIVENDIEEAALEILRFNLDYDYIFGPDIAPNSENPIRNNWSQIILEERLNKSLKKINDDLGEEITSKAIRKIKRLKGNQIKRNNKKFHRFLKEGIKIEYRNDNGEIRTETVRLIHNDPEKNDFLVINQFTIVEKGNTRRPDLVLFLNGLPISVFELKNPGDEKADLSKAYKQLQTYKNEIPSIFCFNEFLGISDGTYAQVGTITSSMEWFLPWKTIDGEKVAPKALPQLEVLLKGMFRKETLIDLINNFTTFSSEKKKLNKILAGYHQYHAANKAVEQTKKAVGSSGKIGVIWHTQGSGKSLTLAFYSGKIQQTKELKNPTLVILTDRNDLDEQLFNTFSSLNCLREKPVQAESTKNLKKLLNRSSGGIIFTTIQKFRSDSKKFELISERDNIIVAADEAHRTQYGFEGKLKNGKIKYGYAKYLRDALPNAAFIGFTGTPIDFEDRSTREVFGDYIDVYDIKQSIKDERTVPIYYESRLAKIKLSEEILKHLDEDFEEITELEEREKKEKLKSSWTRLEKIVGSDGRLEQVAKDILDHFEKRQSTMEGKAMIVCMSRRICVKLYNLLSELRPNWVHGDDDKGKMKVIMSGSSSDGPKWQKHIRTKKRRKDLAKRFKDPETDFNLAIVRDMWLTGFDAPSLNTLYVDKPMKGHNLMQAIARVNRVYKDKEGGLIVDYIGIGQDLKKASDRYTRSGGKGEPVFEEEKAISLMEEKYEIVKQMFHNYNYKKFFEASPKEKMRIIPEAMDQILSLNNGKKRFIKQTIALKKSFALVSSSSEAEKIRDDVAFFDAVKASIIKNTETGESSKSKEELNSAIKQIFSKTIKADGVIDVFESAGIEKPDISILSDEFLEEVRGMKHKNLAFESLKKLLKDQIRVQFRKNEIKSRKFSELLEKTVKRYQNRSIDSAQVIDELVSLAKEVKEEKEKGNDLGLSEEEEAFYDALANNESALNILGSEKLKEMAAELTRLVRKNVSIDWTIRDNVKAKLRVMVKRLLRKYGYPPDKRKMATDLVLDQAKRIASDWSDEKITRSYYEKLKGPNLAVTEGDKNKDD